MIKDTETGADLRRRAAGTFSGEPRFGCPDGGDVSGMTEVLDREGNPVDWTPVRAVVFDVDGTLYRQRPVRIRMACRLAGYFLLHPLRIRELLGIRHFRKLRETERYRKASLEEQIRAAAEKAGIGDPERLREAIQRWMFTEPLSAVAACADGKTLDLLRQARAEGKRILIYSDYAPEEKLAALDVRADAVYYPGRDGIDELKPSEKCMRRILDAQGLSPAETVYVGDRDERDGAAAASVGARYVPVQGLRGKKRAGQ